MKRFVSIALVLIVVATLFAACGKKAPEGKYVVKTVNGKTLEEYLKDSFKEELGGEDVEIKDILELLDIDSLEDFMYFEFKSDGTVKFVSPDGEDSAKWEMDGDKIKITADGETEEMTMSGSDLVFKLDGDEYVFTKK